MKLIFIVIGLLPFVGTAADNIIFADPEVKRLCVENWDIDGDGELSKDEAAAVSDLGRVFFGNMEITSFDEYSTIIVNGKKINR